MISDLTCEEYIKKLSETYRLISVLADRNDCKTLRLRHKELGKDIVLHKSNKPCPFYEFLLKVKCDNLPLVYEVITLCDGQIVLEEYIDGLNVSQVMESGKYRKRGARKLMISVCNALEILHKNGFVHRDLKPDNIMVTKKGRVVLIDFNTTRKETPQKKDTEIMGTAGYASPEQIGISKSDSRTDIYSAGVLLNVLLTGVHPSEKIPKGKLGRVIKKCTNINPDNRFRTVRALKNSL